MKIRGIILFVLLMVGSTAGAKDITVSTVNELKDAVANAAAGDIIRVAAGNYVISTIPGFTISKSGTATNKIQLIAVDGERPVLNFTGQTRDNSSARGVILKASYWHIKGIDFHGAGDNGMQISGGHYNIIEYCRFYRCNDTGLQVDNASSYNLVLNCDSYFNADATQENADGFAPKMSVGSNNKFVGCRAWRNLDDGFDGYLRGTDNVTTYYEDCWVFDNGKNEQGVNGVGDGNGFKTGGSDALSGTSTKTLKHNAVLTRCIAVNNRVKGFDHNSNRGDVTLYNCAATGNATNMGFSSTNPLNKLTIKNSVVVGSTGSLNATTKDISNNSWDSGVSATATDYVDFTASRFYEMLSAPRKADGSLPDLPIWLLVSGSDLIDKGVNVGLSFVGSAPDLGPFEYDPLASIQKPTVNDGRVVLEQFYTISGQEVHRDYQGVLIIRRTYEDGSQSISKMYQQK